MLGFLSEEKREDELKPEAEAEFMSDKEISEFLRDFRDSVPSFVLSDVQKALSGRKVTREQLLAVMERIVSRALDMDSELKNRVDELSTSVSELKDEVSELKNCNEELASFAEELERLRGEMIELREMLNTLMRDMRLVYGRKFNVQAIVDEVLQGA
ncbi:MAG: hypothetical protein GXN98_04185 [Euryarchaeota archaeon]|nr:hypothetical protein [Euryarchaeota archaeon]